MSTKNENYDDSNREYINKTRQLSREVNQAGIQALTKVISQLINSIEDKNNSIHDFNLKTSRENKIYLPFRPLVYGGDDVTFVCDGRLGISLASLYLKYFEEQNVSVGKNKLRACAGIAIVKAHYPFARAYEMSEALCQNAKKLVRQMKREEEEDELDLSAMDWHIASSGLFGSVGEIRAREYQVEEGSLTMRPLILDYDGYDLSNWCTWSSFITATKGFKDGIWNTSRNKLMDLREIMRFGGNKTESFLQINKVADEIPQIQQDGLDLIGLTEKCWAESPPHMKSEKLVCGYFDAIEAMEFYYPLSAEKINE